MTAPLEDKQLEAAAQIVCAGNSQQTIDEARAGVVEHEVGALAILSTAIRETHTDVLAEALEEAVRQIEYLHNKFGQTGSGNGVIARCSAVLAAYKEIANDQPKHRS